MTELKPCPLCGGDAVFSDIEFVKKVHYAFVSCPECQICVESISAFGAEQETLTMITDVWNRRVCCAAEACTNYGHDNDDNIESYRHDAAMLDTIGLYLLCTLIAFFLSIVW